MDKFDHFSVCIDIDNLKVQELVCMFFRKFQHCYGPLLMLIAFLQHEKQGSVLYFDSLTILVIWAWIRIDRTSVLT